MQARSASDAQGIDVSAYQGTINWSQVRASGISFAFIKATEGTSLTDSLFATNYAQAKAAGVLRGAYHFARPGASAAAAQAQYFLHVLEAAGGAVELPPVLDVEDAGGLNQSELVSWITEWMDAVQTATGVQPLLYTYPSFAETYLTSALAKYPLWIASYGVNAPANVNGWTEWTFWQYSDTGTVQGVTGSVDLDVYNGTVAQLRSAYGLTTADPGGTVQPSTPAAPPTYTQFNVFVLDHPYAAIAVGDVTYVLWTALNTLGTPHTYRGNGVMNINGTDVQGVVFQGNTYLPWNTLAPGIKSERVWHFYTS
ncbi:MAG: 1,4-beta-N-acetylmuramidase [Alicyclobacillus sp.]|nr:1,4-beta-N-acetylmuramidase [Alicyclobacillus sp.]